MARFLLRLIVYEMPLTYRSKGSIKRLWQLLVQQ
ncbi:hypothetical protein CCACVL1_10250 [Corchorus capsularis]|uniref:Uncharacterized protein n=1 Tax=Corchorus capsularis TaxID=210143 RepID=A0A1R3IRY6_COCAP|nr:hypothetical protein CCACVL1_10250 [Corchorus capsularis]